MSSIGGNGADRDQDTTGEQANTESLADSENQAGSERIVFLKTWRSESQGLILLALMLGGCTALSVAFPITIVTGPLFEFGSWRVSLSLPLLWLLPASWLSLLAFRIYNVRFSADERGLEARTGILSLNQTITRLRYEDVRSLEMDQTILERVLNVGDLEVGTAGTAGVEMILSGVGAPFTIKNLIQERRALREGDQGQEIMPPTEPITP